MRKFKGPRRLTYKEVTQALGVMKGPSNRTLSDSNMALAIVASSLTDGSSAAKEAYPELDLHKMTLEGMVNYWAPLAYSRLKDFYPGWNSEDYLRIIARYVQVRRTARVIAPTTDQQYGQTLQFLANWYLCGMQTVQMSAEVAAQLMATTVSRQVLEELESPWPTFVVHIPCGLIRYVDSESKLKDCTDILVGKAAGIIDRPYSLHIFGTGDFDIYTSSFSTLAEVLDNRIESKERDMDPNLSQLIGEDVNEENLRLHDVDSRSIALAKNLVGALLVHWRERYLKLRSVATGLMLSEVPKTGPRLVPVPVRHVFQAMMPVDLNARKAVQEFVLHGGKSPTVQTLVMGHYKMQPYGPHGSLRKLIYRKPYWRGPADAPIARRPHVMAQVTT